MKAECIEDCNGIVERKMTYDEGKHHQSAAPVDDTDKVLTEDSSGHSKESFCRQDAKDNLRRFELAAANIKLNYNDYQSGLCENENEDDYYSDRNDTTASLRQFQRDLNRRLKVPNNDLQSHASSWRQSVRSSKQLLEYARCLSDGDDDDDQNPAMIQQIANHYDTPRKDVTASLKAFQLDIEFVKQSEHKNQYYDEEDEEEYSEALNNNDDSSASSSDMASFASDSLPSPSAVKPESVLMTEPSGTPPTVTTEPISDAGSSFPLAPPLTEVMVPSDEDKETAIATKKKKKKSSKDSEEASKKSSKSKKSTKSKKSKKKKIDHSGLSLKELKQKLEACGISTDGFLEKSEFVKALENFKEAERAHKQAKKKLPSPKLARSQSLKQLNVDGAKVGTRSSEICRNKYAENERVLYIGSNGETEQATILKVHLDDDLVPFYDIRLHKSRREKQTDDAHLVALPRRKKSKSGKSDKKKLRHSSTSSLRTSTEYSFTSDQLKKPDASKRRSNITIGNLVSPRAIRKSMGATMSRASGKVAKKVERKNGRVAKKKDRNAELNLSWHSQRSNTEQPPPRRSSMGIHKALRSSTQRSKKNELSLSWHSASSQRSLEQRQRRTSMGAIPKTVRSAKPRSNGDLSLSMHSSSSQRSTERQPPRRSRMGAVPRTVRSSKPRSNGELSLSMHSSSSQRSTERPPPRRSSIGAVPKTVRTLKPRSNGELSLSVHSSSSRNSAQRPPPRRSSMGKTPKTVRSSKPRSNGDLSLSCHSTDSRRSTGGSSHSSSVKKNAVFRRTKSVDLLGTSFSPRHIKTKDDNGISLSQHSASSQSTSTKQNSSLFGSSNGSTLPSGFVSPQGMRSTIKRRSGQSASQQQSQPSNKSLGLDKLDLSSNVTKIKRPKAFRRRSFDNAGGADYFKSPPTPRKSLQMDKHNKSMYYKAKILSK